VRATLTGPSLVARVGAELFGTFVVLLAGLGAALFASVTGAGVIGVALGFGFGTIGAFIAVAHVSGGHFNPAITLGSALAGRTPWGHVVPYWLAQLVGGALAAAVLFVASTSLEALTGNERSFFSGTANGFEAHSPIAQSTGGTGFGLLAALLIEAVLAAILVGVYLGATDRRGTRQQAAFAVGLTVAFAVLVAYPVTGGALNPARATAAAIFSESWAWGQLWVFWVAPLVGAAIAALLYRAFAAEPQDDDLLDEEIELDEVEVEVQPQR
jgi:aquaporin Z